MNKDEGVVQWIERTSARIDQSTPHEIHVTGRTGWDVAFQVSVVIFLGVIAYALLRLARRNRTN